MRSKLIPIILRVPSSAPLLGFRGHFTEFRIFWAILGRKEGTQTLHTMFTSFLVSLHIKEKKYVHFILKPLHTWGQFIPRVTSYQGHFISVTSYQSHLMPVHYIPCSTSYQGYFIPVTSYHASFRIKVTSYQCTSYSRHLIPVLFILVSSYLYQLDGLKVSNWTVQKFQT